MSHMNDLVALCAKHDENVANLDVAKTSLSHLSHELAKAKHELELVKDAPIVCDCGRLFSLFLGLFHQNQG